jgi:hypothetical protein
MVQRGDFRRLAALGSTAGQWLHQPEKILAAAGEDDEG